jgi:glycosyltransferase involved in cell wall biosynthesis
MVKHIPKVAIFFDWLNQWGGAERVLQDIVSIFPDAPIYTLVYDPVKTSWLPQKVKIFPSILNKFPFSKNNPLLYTPIYDLILEQFDLSQYDIIISTTSTVGHSLLTKPDSLFICYFHNINRYLYNTPNDYWYLKPLLKVYESIDKIESCRPDKIFCNSQTVYDRIKNIYKKSATIINPGIDTNFFKPSPKSSNFYFLIVNRLVPHKNTDIVIKAFKNLPYKLNIIGTGRYQNKLKLLAHDNPNIHFLGNVSQNELLNYYQNCRALISPQIEDFGLTQIEAQACGKPVIALGIGGNTETVINGKTGIYFTKATPQLFSECIKTFINKKFSKNACRINSLRFSRQIFMLNFKQAVDNLWQEHLTNIS